MKIEFFNGITENRDQTEKFNFASGNAARLKRKSIGVLSIATRRIVSIRIGRTWADWNSTAARSKFLEHFESGRAINIYPLSLVDRSMNLTKVLAKPYWQVSHVTPR